MTDHVCWVCAEDDDAGFGDAVRTFLAGGLARGERLLCVGERIVDSVRADLPPFTGVDALAEAGTLQLMTLADAYDASSEFAPERQLSYYDAATRRALDEGYTGLRVVADVSVLAADPRRHSELVRWEQVADQYMAQGPRMTAMCVYSGALPAAVLADVTTVHPSSHHPDGGPQFRIFFDENHLAVVGSIDTFEAARLARVLESSPTPSTSLLDLSRLEFVDVAGSRAIARWAAGLCGRGMTVEIRGASRLFRQIWRLLDLDEVAPVTFTEVRP